MGLSLTSAMIGLGLVVIGIVFLLVARRRRTGIGFLVAGVAFIILPYSIIYFLFN